MWAHLSTMAGFFLPLANFVGPLAIWLSKRRESPFIEEHAREALNFQISIFIYAIVSALLCLVLIGILLLLAVGVLALAAPVIAAIKANEGVTYRYPLTIRFVR
ncbi:MAG: DUF4870 domain-containing protein [Verrucomicrobiae bacterium]|nr:DUF4870 domain-containing protein [Verrucomicrobiae bacterium]